MRHEVQWKWVEDEESKDWDQTGCLYAFTDPESDEILFVGRTEAGSVRQGCEAVEHGPLWTNLREIGVENVGVLIGIPQTAPARTDPMLEDIRQLLVLEIDPTGNQDGVVLAGPSEGLEVECTGDWPYEDTVFAAL